MKTISKFLLCMLVLLLVSLGTISASENVSDTSQTADIVVEKQIANDNLIEETITESNVEKINQNKTIEKNIEVKNYGSTKKATQIKVTSTTYDQFFTTKSGQTVTTDLIQNGDIINLQGTFKNVTFVLDKSITLTSLNKNAKLYNCSVYVQGLNASGSKVSNLTIINSKAQATGIHVNGSKNLVIENNDIKVNGLNSFAFAADEMTYSTVRSNILQATEVAEREVAHTTLVLGSSHYNNIANNTINCEANGIYLSVYGNTGASFIGGACNYNNITGNKVTGIDSGWCYSIQIMGANNIVSYNNISGGLRGISTQDYTNNIIENNDVDAFGIGIYACEGATVSGNNVHVSGVATGITIGGAGAKLTGNTISTTNGSAIDIGANDATILKNTITSTNGYGIYSKGQYTNIVINNNKIVTAKEGIIFKQQSKSKKINNVALNSNIVTSNAEYAVDFEQAGSLSFFSLNITVAQSNVLTSSRGKGLNLAYLKPSNADDIIELDSNQVITVTSKNYDEWFDGGVANIKVKQNATIYLKGNFKNVDFTFNKKVHIIGQKCVITNGTVTLTGDAHASTVTDITIKNNANDLTKHCIDLLDVSNCEVTYCTLANYASYESIGIFVYNSQGNYIYKNTVSSFGDYINNAIMLYASDSNTVLANKIKVKQYNTPIPYDESVMFNDKIGSIKEVLHTHGIMAIYSSYNTIQQNSITGISMFKKYTYPTNDCKNSIVGIDIYFDSHNNQVLRNYVSITSQGPFVYGMGVLGGYWGSSISALNATGNLFHSNKVIISAGYFGTGFIAGRNSVDTVLKLNTFKIVLSNNDTNRGDYAHGITLENSTGTVVAGNNISASGCAVYAMELFDSHNNLISRNGISGVGTEPRAIAAYRSSNNNITGNQITLKKVNYGNAGKVGHADVIPVGDEGILLMYGSKSNIITSNLLSTNASTTVKIDSSSTNNTVTGNSLKSKTLYEDKSVINEAKNNNVSNNFVYFVNATVSPVKAMLGDTVVINVTVSTTTTKTSNLKVTYKIGTNVIGTGSVVNGKSSLRFTIPTLYNPTVYYITVELSGKYFQNVTAKAKASFTKAATTTIVSVYEVIKPVGYNATLYANITTATGGKISSGKAQFYLDDKYLFTKNVNLGRAFGSYTIANDAPAGVHTIRVVYLGTADYATSEGTNILGIQTKSEIAFKATDATIGENSKFTVVLKSGGVRVAQGDITFYLDGKKVAVGKLSNGQVTYSYMIPTTVDKGVHTLKAEYAGNETTAKISREIKFTVNPMTPVIHYNNTKVKAGNNVSLVIGIDNGLTGSGNALAKSGNVTVQLNGKTLNDAKGNAIVGTVKEGKLTIKFTAPEQLKGNNNITFVYSGNEKFDKVTTTFNNALTIE